jgi:hypothetical protein
MSEVKRYRKKPEPPVEAVQWTGGNFAEVVALTEPDVAQVDGHTSTLLLGGDRAATRGDYIVRDSDGALDTITAKTFQATYEEVADGEGEKTGVELIAAERERQVCEEGWTPEHDATHTYGELAIAASGYALVAGRNWDRPTGVPRGATPMDWPWAPEWFKPTGDAVRDLTKAGALIAAEIDRLQRAALTQHTTSGGSSDE